MSYEIYNTLVEKAIAQLGIDPAEARTDNTGQWNIAKDEDTQVMLDVWEENDHWFFQILSPVCEVGDENNSAFLRFLLEQNHGLCETAFTILDNGIFLKYTTEAADITEERVLKNITRMAYYIDMFREKLS